MNRDEIKNLIHQEIEASRRTAQFSTSRVPFHRHNNLDSPQLGFIGLRDAPASFSGQSGEVAMVNNNESALIFSPLYGVVAKDTNGTTNVNVFSSSGAPFAFTVTGVFLISKDTTAGDITLLQGGNTVCTIAKGVTAGVMVGATSLSNTVYAVGDVCQVDSSSAGNATVFITFTT